MAFRRRWIWRYPYEVIRDLQDEIERALKYFFGRLPERALAYPEFAEPCVDLEDREKEFYLCADLPGMKKEDIEINAAEDGIEIRVEAEREAEAEKKGYVRRERTYRGFYRRVSLPAKIKPNEVKAKYRNGVLEVHMPKAKVVSKGIRIKIE